MRSNVRTASSPTRISLVTTMTFVAIASTYACAGDEGGTAPQPPDPPRATVVRVTPATAELTALGATTQLAAEVRDQNGQVMGGASVTWSSGTPEVAVVDASGLVTAASEGTATITATAGSVSGTATVTVAQRVITVEVFPGTDTLAAGDTLRLTASAADANGNAVAGAVFEWATSDAAVAVVDEAGLVTAVAAGAVTMTASSSDARGTANITVIGERAALEALYRATDGPNWITSDNWVTEAPLGDWYGVETDSAGSVVALFLARNNLNGRMPPGIGYLTNLTRLVLYTNNLSGAIPPELGSLASLTYLDLGENDFSGSIPPELGTHLPV